MKRIVPVLLALLILLLLPFGAQAAPVYDGYALKAGGVVLMNADTGEILVSGNGTGKIYPASTTKIMTCLLALENGNLDDTITVSANAASYNAEGNSRIYLIEGERMTLRQMLYGMMLQSGNDAAVAVAEYVSGSVEKFADLMNKKAKELGMTSTHFVNPHGLHDDDHYSTAVDMATLTRAALENGHFAKIVSTVSYEIGATNKSAARSWRNTNRLIRTDNDFYFEGATGVKTGSTGTALGCLVASATRDGISLIACVFNDGDYSGELRWPYAISLLKFGYENYGSFALKDVMESASSSVTVQNAAEDDAQGGNLVLSVQYDESAKFYGWTEDVQTALTQGDTVEIQPEFDTAMVYAPINQGAVLGEGKILLNGKEIGECELAATRAVAENPATSVPSTASQAPGGQVSPGDAPNLLSILFIVIAGLVILILLLRLFNKARRRKRRFASRKRRTTASARSCSRPYTKRRPPNRPVR